ncbi:MAG: helix-turn-helix transcriptional regulator, partial [Bacteroidota bacterium]|nr:helix-turn-helix transcriptional regulator [Bacteroidota bacterium]
MKEKLPINKDVLVWARTSLRLSMYDVAQRLGREVQEIESWEAGMTSPTYSQLERLAHDVYKRPVAVFFFPTVPEEETPTTEFRTLPDAIVNELPSEIIKLYRKAKLYQLYLEELYDGVKPIKTS